jgi:hypothetical protein
METTAPETEIVPANGAAAPRPLSLPAVKTPRAIMLAAALEEEREQRILLKKYVDEFMVVDEDYGVIPGTGGSDKKKARRGLFKPGAEKLFDLFRCRPEYEFISREVDRDAGLYSYEIKCKAVSRETDTVLNEGVGSASSYESKYRYRNAGRVCPACNQPAISKSKYPPRGRPRSDPGGWWCSPKNGGCGQEFDHDDVTITGQECGKIQNPDLADVANTVLKMAKKRAQVDCAIALARVSDMFTQDVEDMPGVLDGGAPESEPSPFNEGAPAEARQTPRKEAPKKVETPPKSSAPPPYVMALWNRLVKQEGGNKKLAKAHWDKAAEAAGAPVESKDWTQEHAAAVESNLWPKDVP